LLGYTWVLLTEKTTKEDTYGESTASDGD
jgi:hypothetical protein